MFSDTGFMDSMLQAHRLKVLAGQKHCHDEQGGGRGCESLRYCCTCPDTKKRCREQSRC